eukprot:Lankesteria_metandrocarpae@DN2852_c0_g1_i1.p1
MDAGKDQLLAVLQYVSDVTNDTCTTAKQNDGFSLSSETVAAHMGLEHNVMIGMLKSLASRGMLILNPHEKHVLGLRNEGRHYADTGTPELLVLRAINKAGTVPVSALKSGGEIADGLGVVVCDIGLKLCMKNKLVMMDKVNKTVSPLTDSTANTAALNFAEAALFVLKIIPQKDSKGEEVEVNVITEAIEKEFGTATTAARLHIDALADLKRRNLILQKTLKYSIITRGPKFALTIPVLATDLNSGILQNDAWKNFEFKAYNFMAAGIRPKAGSVHPLMAVQKEFKEILVSMGFEEMPTSQWADTSFWNFDALFMPQQHPCRDVQDTFFLTDPVYCDKSRIPQDYFKDVQRVHEIGDFESIGWRYPWSETEASKNILRTHTTAVSARMLYNLGQEYIKTGKFQAKRYFSIDRVFRNERLDETHLAEFHQVEGLIADEGMTLGHLMGVLKTFYKHIGIEQLKFKPAYNPYTEPSMEIFGYHPQLQRWIEVGNSGIFRPEMLRPMGLPPSVSVIAWGLSLERPTMIRYGIRNIRDLFGHKAAVVSF